MDRHYHTGPLPEIPHTGKSSLEALHEENHNHTVFSDSSLLSTASTTGHPIGPSLSDTSANTIREGHPYQLVQRRTSKQLPLFSPLVR